MNAVALIEDYQASAGRLRAAVAGFSPEQLKLRPIPGKWSTLEVVCHLTDFEIVRADRIKSVIAENRPQLPGRDEKLFAARLHYHDRDVDDELALVDAIHRQLAAILRALDPDDFRRVGMHSEVGPVTLEALVAGATGHIAHHLRFVAEKRRALGL